MAPAQSRRRSRAAAGQQTMREDGGRRGHAPPAAGRAGQGCCGHAAGCVPLQCGAWARVLRGMARRRRAPCERPCAPEPVVLLRPRCGRLRQQRLPEVVACVARASRLRCGHLWPVRADFATHPWELTKVADAQQHGGVVAGRRSSGLQGAAASLRQEVRGAAAAHGPVAHSAVVLGQVRPKEPVAVEAVLGPEVVRCRRSAIGALPRRCTLPSASFARRRVRPRKGLAHAAQERVHLIPGVVQELVAALVELLQRGKACQAPPALRARDARKAHRVQAHWGTGIPSTLLTSFRACSLAPTVVLRRCSFLRRASPPRGVSAGVDGTSGEPCASSSSAGSAGTPTAPLLLSRGCSAEAGEGSSDGAGQHWSEAERCSEAICCRLPPRSAPSAGLCALWPPVRRVTFVCPPNRS